MDGCVLTRFETLVFFKAKENNNKKYVPHVPEVRALIARNGFWYTGCVFVIRNGGASRLLSKLY